MEGAVAWAVESPAGKDEDLAAMVPGDGFELGLSTLGYSGDLGGAGATPACAPSTPPVGRSLSVPTSVSWRISDCSVGGGRTQSARSELNRNGRGARLAGAGAWVRAWAKLVVGAGTGAVVRDCELAGIGSTGVAPRAQAGAFDDEGVVEGLHGIGVCVHDPGGEIRERALRSRVWLVIELGRRSQPPFLQRIAIALAWTLGAILQTLR